MSDQLRGGLWNMLHHRDDVAVASRAWAILRVNQLDWLALNEAGEYDDDLRDVAPDGGQVVANGSTALITAPGVSLTLRGWLTPDPRGWRTARGGRTGPRRAVSCVVDGWLRVTVVHLPPSVWSRGGISKGRGGALFRLAARVPALRGLSYVTYMRSVGDYVNRHRRTSVIVGDFNATPRDRGPWSPRWLALKVRGRIIGAGKPTLGRREVDFAVVRGVDAQARRLGKNGSDHNAVMFLITRLVN